MVNHKTKRLKFPNPQYANADGVIAMGGSMTVENLLEAYGSGIFPWPHEGFPLLWFSPHERGVISFDKLHIQRSLKKLINKSSWQVTWSKAFLSVIHNCAMSARPGQAGTWITDELTHCYQAFHYAGYAHSLEVWEGEELIGGIYGVFVKNVFSAESMFYKRDNASKFALFKLVEKLKFHGLEWLDVQMLTSITKNFGGEYISQKEFLFLIKKVQEKSPIVL